MAWRAANSIIGLIGAVNAIAPGRSTVSDGTVGDLAHSTRKSDHNPNEYGVVTATDITHDPASGANMHDITNVIRLEQDPRIKYVIWNSRMFASYTTTARAAWTWGPYSGTNRHDKHAHFSVVGDPARYDDTTKWTVSTTISDSTTTGVKAMLPLKESTSVSSDVALLQGMMNRAFGTQLVEDGIYGPNVVAAVKAHLGNEGRAVNGSQYAKLEWAHAVAAAKSVGFGAASPASITTAIDTAVRGHAANPDAHHE